MGCLLQESSAKLEQVHSQEEGYGVISGMLASLGARARHDPANTPSHSLTVPVQCVHMQTTRC